jgi:head-tail adaptor
MAEHYNAGQLQHPFTILRKTQVADGAGGFTESEAQVGSTHFAHIRPLRGDERTQNAGLATFQEMLFVTHSAIEVRVTDVLLYNGVRYAVTSIAPPGLSTFQEISTEAGVVS